MNKIIYNIKHEAISLLLVFLSCSCTGIHPASSSSTETPVAEGDTSTFVVRRAIGGEELFKFRPGTTSYADIHAKVAEQTGTLWPCVKLVSFDAVVENSKISQAHPTGDVSYVVLSDINLETLGQLKLKLAQLELLELYLEKCNPKFNDKSLLEMFKVFRENQDDITQALANDQYLGITNRNSPVSVGNAFSTSYTIYGNSTLVVFFNINSEGVDILVETTLDGTTTIKYRLEHADHSIAYFKKVGGVLIMEIPPKYVHVPLVHNNGDTTWHEHVPLDFEYAPLIPTNTGK